MKPILFNTDMVRAILEGRKTVTRRTIKPKYKPEEAGWNIVTNKHTGEFCYCEYYDEYEESTRRLNPPYFPGDILYVRETWAEMPYGYVYRADTEEPEGWDADDRWSPSIHMPREAARLFLQVKDVRVERLQEISEEAAFSEGVPDDLSYPIPQVYCPRCKGEGLIGCFAEDLGVSEADCPDCNTAVKRFANLWDSIIKPADFDRYGWDANPWVWVIGFEKCGSPS